MWQSADSPPAWRVSHPQRATAKSIALSYRFFAAGLGDSPGGGFTGAPLAPIDGVGGVAGVAGGAIELLGAGGGVISGLVRPGVVVGAIEGIGDGKSEGAGLGMLVISGAGTAGDGSGDGVIAWPLVNKAVPIP